MKDKNSSSTILQRIDPRIKIITHISLIFFTISLNNSSFSTLLVYSLWLLLISLMSKTTLTNIIKRALLVSPFILMASISIVIFTKGGHRYSLGPINVDHNGLLKAASISAKAYISIFSLFLLTQTTSFAELTNGFRGLGVPGVFISLLEFTWRYLSLLLVEICRIKRAADSRGYGARWIWQIKSIGNMVGALFIRSFNRGENIYRAMLSRGYNLDLKSSLKYKFPPKDLLYPLFSIGLFVIIRTGPLML